MNRLSAARKTPSGSAVGVFVMKKLVIPVCLTRVTRARVHRSVGKPAAGALPGEWVRAQLEAPVDRSVAHLLG